MTFSGGFSTLNTDHVPDSRRQPWLSCQKVGYKSSTLVSKEGCFCILVHSEELWSVHSRKVINVITADWQRDFRGWWTVHLSCIEDDIVCEWELGIKSLLSKATLWQHYLNGFPSRGDSSLTFHLSSVGLTAYTLDFSYVTKLFRLNDN